MLWPPFAALMGTPGARTPGLTVLGACYEVLGEEALGNLEDVHVRELVLGLSRCS